MGDTANCEMASTAAGSHPIHPILPIHPAMSSLLVPRGKDVHTISCPGIAVSHAARGIASKENPSAKAATQCGDKCHHRLAPLSSVLAQLHEHVDMMTTRHKRVGSWIWSCLIFHDVRTFFSKHWVVWVAILRWWDLDIPLYTVHVTSTTPAAENTAPLRRVYG